MSASPVLCACRRTDFETTQTLVNIEKKRVIHKKQRALLLLLFIYTALEEQPKSKSSGPKQCGLLKKRADLWGEKKRGGCARYQQHAKWRFIHSKKTLFFSYSLLKK
ncbi:MAG: hypothetical protein K2Q97_14985 [Burkholderiaceae bacterium]|nr:hypothetical protein [Burkholderiaceae bacterium]